MVCIIDDREDVWNYARNLICVQPYTYFKHTGDINDPSLFKQQQSPNTTASTQQPRPNNGTRKRKLDEANNEETSGENNGDAATTTETPDQQQSAQQQEQIEPVDPDDYLEHLERILRTIHDEYYRIYENRVLSHHNNNNNNNHHHHHNESRRRNRINDIDESDLPDVKKILPMIKSRVLEGCVITFSGVVPTGFVLIFS
jgi:RNA polymerase II subunit A-like phosphatase